MRPKGTAQQLEARRMLAVQLVAEGRSIAEVASIVGASASSVRRWNAAAQDGVGSLKAKRHSGRNRLLTKAQERELLKALAQGLSDKEIQGSDWTCSSVADFIQSRFGI